MRILILSSSTGGGHDMRASSFTRWAHRMNQQAPTYQVDRYQALEESSKLYKFGVGLYNGIQKYWPRFHHVYFNFLEVFQVSSHKKLMRGKAQYIARLKQINPDVIISVHAHLNHAFRAIAQEVLPSVKFVTYCGEMHGGYGFSRHWVDSQADLFIGATEEICKAAQQLGMPAERSYHGGFMLHPNFYGPRLTPDERATCLTKLKLQPDRFTLLLSTGANGAQNHQALLHHLDQASLDLQVIALCGHNATAKNELDRWALEHPQCSVVPLAHVENMFPLMQCCDTILARPGTGTTSEAIQANCPILFNAIGGIMPQEQITVKYCRANGLPSGLVKKPVQLIEQLRPLVEQAEHLQATRLQMQALIPSQHPTDILQRIRSLHHSGQ